jgi:ABC-type multidrug transport system ATPase subunit
VGCASDNDIVIPDVLASRHHATLVLTARGIEIRDNRSTNGTFVNGARVESAVLSDGDVVTIGNVDSVFAGGTLIRRSEAPGVTGGLEVRDISVTVDGNRTLLQDVSLSAAPGSLTAVIGPSGSGKSTFVNAIAGGARPARGTVLFDGHDIHATYESLCNRIGVVPQDDVVHRQLTVKQALDYAAELRMPPDTTKQDRARVIAELLDELDLTPHTDTRVDRLSGGQRKRVSVALELLTSPALLILDEPTTGLDPALDQQVMTMLRQLADAGRVVVVVTHSLAHLDVCDQVLLLAPGGKTAFCGPPGQIMQAMGSTDWADIFTTVSADPDAGQTRIIRREVGACAGAVAEKPLAVAKLRRAGLWRQFATLSRRQVRILVADRGHVLLLVLLPFIVGLLPLMVAGDAGFGKPLSDGSAPLEPKHIVALLNFAAILMATTLTVRDLIGERAVFRREQAAGLSASAYLLAKIAVFGTVAIFQSAVLVLAVTAPGIGKPAPAQAAVLGSPMFELFVGVAVTCVVAVMLGLLVSAVAQTSDQVIMLLAAVLTAQLVLAGGFIPVTGRPLLDALSWLTPARWGFAATASTADLTNLVVGIARDAHWQHTASAWCFNVAMLGVLAVCYCGTARWKLRRKGVAAYAR